MSDLLDELRGLARRFPALPRVSMVRNQNLMPEENEQADQLASLLRANERKERSPYLNDDIACVLFEENDSSLDPPKGLFVVKRSTDER